MSETTTWIKEIQDGSPRWILLANGAGYELARICTENFIEQPFPAKANLSPIFQVSMQAISNGQGGIALMHTLFRTESVLGWMQTSDPPLVRENVNLEGMIRVCSLTVGQRKNLADRVMGTEAKRSGLIA